MKIRVVSSGLAAVIGVAALPGCISSSDVESSITQQSSVGQQLTDLDKAYQQGVVTEKEYLKLRKAIIRNND